MGAWVLSGVTVDKGTPTDSCISFLDIFTAEAGVLPFRVEDNKVEHTSAVNISKKDFVPGSMKIDRALAGQVAGLKVTRASGMPGEGSYMNMRGIRSLVADNAPLVVINGVPYLPDSRESQLFNGYTRDIFQSYNIHDDGS